MMRVFRMKRRETLLALVCTVALLIFLIRFFTWGPEGCTSDYRSIPQLQEALEYCNFVDKLPVSGQEGNVPIKDWNLESVHMLIRHGDRLNLHSLPSADSKLNISCMVGNSFNAHVPKMASFDQTMKDNTERLEYRNKLQDFGLYPRKTLCEPAWLTPEGAAQHVKNGEFLREIYQDKWHLVSNEDYTDEVYVRSTSTSRTYQSAMALLYGFLPSFDVSKLNVDMATNNSMCSAETKFPCDCPYLTKYIDNMSPNFAQTRPAFLGKARVQKLYSHIADTLEITRSALPKLTNILDAIMVRACHNIQLPSKDGKCIHWSSVREVMDLINQNGLHQVDHPTMKRAVKLKFQPLFNEIVNRMIAQSNHETPIKFVLYSGHDTTIEPFMSALGYGKGRWPPYASRIVLELYTSTKKEESGKSFIRVLHNGHVVTKRISFCKKNIVETTLGLCPLEYFRQFVDYGNLRDLGEKSYHEACSRKAIGEEGSDH